jgi:hypothetical protein
MRGHACTFSSLEGSYGIIYHADSISMQLFKIHYTSLEPYKKIIFYFIKNDLIKIIEVNNSKTEIVSYFQKNKLLYVNPDDDERVNNSFSLLIKSMEYLDGYNSTIKEICDKFNLHH